MIEQKAPGHFSVSGQMTIPHARQIMEAGQAVFQGGKSVGQEQFVDLSPLTRADSSGLAILLEWQRAASAAGKGLRFINAPKSLKTLAGLYNLDKVLELE